MNAAHVNPNPPTPSDALSALVDGELDAGGLDELIQAIGAQPQALGDWHTYQVIGAVLRGSETVVSARSPVDFLSGVRERLKTEGVVRAVQDRPVAAAPHVGSQRAPAANDAVFRWKMVAGLASLAAVMAVSWSVIGGAAPGPGGQAGPQLASSSPAPAPAAPVAASPAPSAVASAEPAPSTAVVVNTGQGVLIRDARLEELLAEHRQHGGMSALQMPTGFIRGATYDASGR